MASIESSPVSASPEPPVVATARFRDALRDSLRGRPLDCTQGPLGRVIVLLAVPMVLEAAMESLFAVVDMYFVSRLGAASVAAVGMTESVLTLLYAISLGLSAAATAVVARRIGEGNEAGASRAAAQAIGLGVVLGLGLGVPGVLFAPRILALMGASPAVVAAGSGYASLMFGANVVILLLFLNNAVFRGAGDPALAMRVLWLANGINMVLDPCLIYGLGPFPELGVTGAALATTIGRGIGVLYQFRLLRKGRGRVRLAGEACRLEPPVLKEIARISVGGVAQLLIATASWVVLMRVAASAGATAVAGFTIAIRIIMFALLPAWGFANAAATLVGQNLGARKPERAERAVWLTGLGNTGVLGLVTVAFLAFAPWLVSFFGAEPEVQAVAVTALRVISAGYVFYAWGMVLANAFNGAGDTVTPTWLNLVFFWLVQIPLAFLLAERVGLAERGVFWSIALAETGLALASMVVFRRGRWKETRIAPDPAAAVPH